MVNFKQTQIGTIPEDWEVINLDNALILLKNGMTTSQNKDNSGYPVTRIETISDGKINPNKVGYVSKVTENDLKNYRLNEGDILFSHINSVEHIGKTAIYEGSPSLLLHGMNLLLLRPTEGKTNPDFLLFLLRLFRQRGIFKSMCKKAVNQASINQTELGGLKIPLPPLPEQKAIAEILSTADEAIRKSDEIIAKTGLLKKGLMQELLTKGIVHEEFKDTEIGRILKEWEVVKLGDVCEQRNEIVLSSGKGEFRFVGLEHINSGETKIREYKPDTNVKSSKFRFYLGDILYGKLRPYLDKTALSDFEGICSTDLLVLKSNKNKILAEFLTYLIHSNRFIQYAIATTSGTNHPRTSWSHINKFKFGLPPLPEQQKIILILSTVERKLELERSRKQKLERIKKGLMNDLLTGNKRVGVST